jgi:hypothetical protein
VSIYNVKKLSGGFAPDSRDMKRTEGKGKEGKGAEQMRLQFFALQEEKAKVGACDRDSHFN